MGCAASEPTYYQNTGQAYPGQQPAKPVGTVQPNAQAIAAYQQQQHQQQQQQALQQQQYQQQLQQQSQQQAMKQQQIQVGHFCWFLFLNS
jgi:nicotinamide mononucleotide (NMN) deamidase PncC